MKTHLAFGQSVAHLSRRAWTTLSVAGLEIAMEHGFVYGEALEKPTDEHTPEGCSDAGESCNRSFVGGCQ